MSTRGSIFLHKDKETDITIHIYEECASGIKQDIRLEIEHPYGTINVPWPKGLTKEEVLKLAIQPYSQT